MAILDKLGKEIAVGCYIAYGHALGRCAGIRIGKVLKAEAREEKWYGRTTPSHIIYRITVQGINDDWSFRDMELNSRVGTLLYPDRAIVLDSVPDEYRKLLEEA